MVDWSALIELLDVCLSVVTRETCAPNELHRTLTDQSGYITPPGPSTVAAGSARCPWTITVDRRQGIRVILHTFGEHQTASSAGGECPLSAVFNGRVEKSLCPLRTHAVRQRLLHSTDSNELTISFKVVHDRPLPRQPNYMLQYEGTSANLDSLCALQLPKHARSMLMCTCK